MTSPSARPLGRLAPTDFEHVSKYPLRALAGSPSAPRDVPVCTGFVWWPEYDRPVRGDDGRWRITPTAGRNARGGHAFVFKPARVTDPASWWAFYDQGTEGACVGFSQSRCMSLLNRRRYSGQWLYGQARRNDEWPGEDYDGTSVRAGFEVLRTTGPARVERGKVGSPSVDDGITAYRWATTAEEVRAALGYSTAVEEVPMLNSWGRAGYPHLVYWPLSEIDRQLTQWDGEAGVVTDR